MICIHRIVTSTLLTILITLNICACGIDLTGDAEPECVPRCDGTRCFDGCGGNCECAPGKVCNAQRYCVSPESCVETYQTLDWKCGVVCGEFCGICTFDRECVDGDCICAPQCADGYCGSNGCGGMCACAAGLQCNSKMECVAKDECQETCESAGWECGKLCNRICGACSGYEDCIDGACICETRCDGTHCGPDGCGGSCVCAPGTQCNADEECVDQTICEDTCESVGWECDIICGDICGECGADERCEAGLCACVPKCEGLYCGGDGCGGTCECPESLECDDAKQCVIAEECLEDCSSAGRLCGRVCDNECGECAVDENCVAGGCEEVVSCPECPLVMSLVEKKVQGENITEVVLAVDYLPGPYEPRPRLLDLHLRTAPAVELSELVEGPALTDAGKNLGLDPYSGKPWMRVSDDYYRFVALSMSNTNTLVDGRLVTLTFNVNLPGPVKLELLKREQIFAPADADGALQATPYHTPVVIMAR